jgi:hypothetical protein
MNDIGLIVDKFLFKCNRSYEQEGKVSKEKVFFYSLYYLERDKYNRIRPVKLLTGIEQLVKLNAILKFYVSNRVDDDVYKFSDAFHVKIEREKGKIKGISFVISTKSSPVYIDKVDASILQFAIDKLLQRVGFFSLGETITNRLPD